MKKSELCRRAAALFGVTSCISCNIISVNLMLFGDILLTEPNLAVIILEVIIGVTGTILNLYVLAGRAKEAEG